METNPAVMEWLNAFPFLNDIKDDTWSRAMRSAQIVTLSPGQSDINSQALCLILEGSVRARMVSDAGNEISLCRTRAGQMGWFNIYALMVDDTCGLDVDVVIEVPTRMATIPKTHFRDAIDDSRVFRNFIFSKLTSGITDLMGLVEEIRFGHMNRRVAQWLLAKSEVHQRVYTTHNDLALELGTAREVVSRLLKDFERSGWVRLHRGRIDVVNKTGLRGLAHDHYN